MTPSKGAPDHGVRGGRHLAGVTLLLCDAATAAWLWYALRRFTADTGNVWPAIALPVAATLVLSSCLRIHLHGPGRPGSLLLRIALLAAGLGGLGCMASVRLHISHGEALWAGGSIAALIWVQRSVFLGTLAVHLGKPSEALRWILVGLAGTLAMLPFYHAGALGSGDAHWYAIMLGDYVTQMRDGVFPIWVGQSTYAFNGAVSPLRYAPGFHFAGGCLDLLTLQSLEVTALRNALLAVTSLVGAFAAYACIRPILKSAPWFACAFAILWITGPGVLAPVMAGDQYMTFMTLPFVPITLHGCWRVWQFDDLWGRIWIAAGLAGLWLCHPPIALWFSLIAAGVYLPVLFAARPRTKEIKLVAAMAAVFLVLGSLPFVSVLTLDNQAVGASNGGSAAESVHLAFPANFLPINTHTPGLSYYQLGYALLGLLLASLGLMARARPRGAWAFALATVLVIPLTVPVPWLTDAAWRHAPAWFVVVQNVWPMQRLFLVWSALIVFTAAIVIGSPRICARTWPRAALTAGLLCGVAWSAREASKLEKGVFSTRATAEQTRVFDGPDNLLLTRYAYASFAYVPRYFSHAYMEPWFENRLLDPGTLEPFLSNADAAAPGGGEPGAPDAGRRLVQSGTWIGHSITQSAYYRLEPLLTLEPGKRYALRVEFLQPGIEGILQVYSNMLFREYTLPDSGFGMGGRGPSLAFGSGPEAGHVLSLIANGSGPVSPTALFIAPRRTTEILPLARFWLYTYKRNELPINVESWVPYQARVVSPRAAYLETPRMWLKGWTARVNGRLTATARSPGNLVMIPIGSGVSHVTLQYAAPLALALSFWACAAGWLALGSAALCWLILSAGGPVIRFSPPGAARSLTLLLGATCAPFLLAWRHRLLALVVAIAAFAAVYARHSWKPYASEPDAAGPIRVEFKRPRDRAGSIQPILATGHAGAGTVIYATFIDSRHARIGADIWGSFVESDMLEMGPDDVQSLVVSDSALFPLRSPRVRALQGSEAADLRGDFRVELNGASIIDVARYAYETEPSELLAGEARFGPLTDSRFLGIIQSVERLPIPRNLALPPGSHAHIRLRFPKGLIGRSEPLLSLSSGSSSRSCIVTYLSRDSLRLTCRAPGGAPLLSAEVSYDPDLEHDLDVIAGDTRDGPASFNVACYLDGARVFGHNPTVAVPVTLATGLNSLEPGIDERFTGSKMDVELNSNSLPSNPPYDFGPVHIVARLPKGLVGSSEPLLTTGHTGAGDFVFVEYVDSGHVRVGFDHWAFGGPVSGPIAVDYGVSHEFWISLGSLFPEIDDERHWHGLDRGLRQRLKSGLSVILDGKSALNAEEPSYASSPDEVFVAANGIGGSTCGPVFTGNVVFVERTGPATPKSGDR
jgi:hypothetical protein